MKNLQAKNRAPAPIQITSEHLLREAKERGLEDTPKPPKQFITDSEELKLYQSSKRKDFEDQLRRQRNKIGVWCKYGMWEAAQKEFVRARSVFERALGVDERNQTIYLKYAEMEMKNKFINHARNVWNRAVTILPRVDAFWLKYSFMEEMIGAISETRQVFERWMKWEPDDQAWSCFIKFEMRQGEIGRARAVFERYIQIHPTSRAYLKYAKWEEKQKQPALARQVYERSISEIHPTERTEGLLVSFARFEERQKEPERARVIYQFALQLQQQQLSLQQQQREKDKESLKQLASSSASSAFPVSLLDEDGTGSSEVAGVMDLKQEYLSFEKRHGKKDEIEEVIISKRRVEYERQVSEDGFDYDAWIDYLRLEESEVAEALEEALGKGGQGPGACLEDEKVQQSLSRTRSLYSRAVSHPPPLLEKRYWRRYIYLWVFYALFEELTARDVERARGVLKDCLALIPHRSFTFGKIWIMAAHLEVRQRDLTAARKIFGRGIGMCGHKPNIFKAYIELEFQLNEMDRVREIHSKQLTLLPSSSSLWIDFANFEKKIGEIKRSRAIYELGLEGTGGGGRGRRGGGRGRRRERGNNNKSRGGDDDDDGWDVNSDDDEEDEEEGEGWGWGEGLDMPELLWKSYIDFEIDVMKDTELEEEEEEEENEDENEDDNNNNNDDGTRGRKNKNKRRERELKLEKREQKFEKELAEKTLLTEGDKTLHSILCGGEGQEEGESEGGGEGRGEGGVVSGRIRIGRRRVRALYSRLLSQTSHVKVWISYGQFEANRLEYPSPSSSPISPPPLLPPFSLSLQQQLISFSSSSSSPFPSSSSSELTTLLSHLSQWWVYLLSREEGRGQLERARRVFEKGYQTLKEEGKKENERGETGVGVGVGVGGGGLGGKKEERLLLLQAWREIEKKAEIEFPSLSLEKGWVDYLAQIHLSPSSSPSPSTTTTLLSLSSLSRLSEIDLKFPKKIKMRRLIQRDGGGGAGEGGAGTGEWEDFYDLHYPDEEKKIVGMKLLENAMKWKQNMNNNNNSSISALSSSSFSNFGDDSSPSSSSSSSLLFGKSMGKRRERDENEIDIEEEEDDDDDDEEEEEEEEREGERVMRNKKRMIEKEEKDNESEGEGEGEGEDEGRVRGGGLEVESEMNRWLQSKFKGKEEDDREIDIDEED